MRISDWSSDVCSSDLRHEHKSPYRPTRCWSANGTMSPTYHCTRRGSADLCKRTRAGHRPARRAGHPDTPRSEEHTSELPSLMRISYAVFCLKKKKIKQNTITISHK